MIGTRTRLPLEYVPQDIHYNGWIAGRWVAARMPVPDDRKGCSPTAISLIVTAPSLSAW
jgi:hypothetical protein